MEAKIKEWAVSDRGGGLICLPVCGETAHSVVVSGGAKIPFDRLWLRCETDCAPLLSAAREDAENIDIEALWRAAAGEKITPVELARRVGADGLPAVLAVLQAILDNPAYFRRHPGCFVPASAAVLERVRESLRRRAAEINAEKDLLAEIRRAETPPPQVMAARGELLAGENKNSVVFRAAKRDAGGEKHIPEWLVKIGACADARECWECLFAHRWLQPPPDFTPPAPPKLPEAEAPAFSIDDSGTFEVDDAFSVRELPGGDFVVGVHIATPSLGLPFSGGDDYGDRRLTSVYFPGGKKFPMLPPACIDAYSLRAGTSRPAMSLYRRFDRKNKILGESRTCVDRVRISHNLKPEDFAHDAPDAVAREYEVLRDFAALLPPVPGGNRTEFQIRTSPPSVHAAVRPPVAILVEKMMRLINSEWALQLRGRGGLFRAAGALSVQPGTEHVYAWASSPLRRYPDLANQRLLLSLLKIAPPPSVQWRKLARAYTLQQTRARHFQDMMERHWVLCALRELPSGTPLRAVWQEKKRIRLRDYPLAGIVVCASGGTPEEETAVRVHEINMFAQRAWFAPL